MPHIPENTDLNSWHRYFAMEANNRAWELAVLDRSSSGDLEMLSAAHAAALHWQALGSELNIMRAKMLLAEVHALLGIPSSYELANEVLAYFDNPHTPDWEIAFAHTIHAHAAHAIGDGNAHANSYSNASNALGVISADEDRAIVMKTFSLVPVPENPVDA